jgi:polysaccharide biosynthesis/export protein
MLREGDVLKISFPRTATLDTTQQIRRDGKINLYLIGEVNAANRSPADLEKELLERYAPQLVAKEVRVTVVSSAFAVFVTGAVVHPGKLTPQRSLTAFEAIMEAGGFDSAKADTKAVTVIRNESGQTKRYTLNLKAVLEGKDAEPFYLNAYDVIYVPERFSWF